MRYHDFARNKYVCFKYSTIPLFSTFGKKIFSSPFSAIRHPSSQIQLSAAGGWERGAPMTCRITSTFGAVPRQDPL